jgi:hypothetical protein
VHLCTFLIYRDKGDKTQNPVTVKAAKPASRRDAENAEEGYNAGRRSGSCKSGKYI